MRRFQGHCTILFNLNLQAVKYLLNYELLIKEHARLVKNMLGQIKEHARLEKNMLGQIMKTLSDTAVLGKKTLHKVGKNMQINGLMKKLP